ncbi:MAG: hypothetical protein ACFFE8_08660 [Candidatus Heimdallarchaeota archaeon]
MSKNCGASIFAQLILVVILFSHTILGSATDIPNGLDTSLDSEILAVIVGTWWKQRPKS